VASATQDGARGRWTASCVGRDGRRRSVRLGPPPKRQAENLRVKIEEPAGTSYLSGINGLDTPATFNGKPIGFAESGAKSGARGARDGRGPSVGPSMQLDW